tara:strand:- start:486 stop:1418 length:933 start_codon:yes stop_codon:yes gene_type:complete
MDNKLIFENWRGFIQRTELLENRDYVQYVLGIQIPLNESVPFSATLSQRILQEQLLLEGFFDKVVQKVKQGASALGSKAMSAIEDVKSWAKEFGDKVGKLFHALWKMMKDPAEIKKYIEILDKRITIRKLPTIKQFTSDAVAMFQGTSFDAAAQTLQKLIDSAIEQYNKMAVSWKKALLGSTMAVFLDYLLSKFKNVIEQVTNAGATATDAAKEELGGMLQGEVLSYFKESFGDLFTKATQYMTGIGAWADWIGKIVGGIDYVATSLYGVTARTTASVARASRTSTPETQNTDLSAVAPAKSTPDVSPAQ